MSSWSDLSEDLLLLIVEKINNSCDFIRFSGVCSSWRLIGKQDGHRFRHKLPCLLYSSGQFFPTTQLQTPKHQKLPILSLPRNTLCRGSYKGWLAMVNQDLSIHLQNPVSGQTIQLPPITPIRQFISIWSVRKVVLSSEPGSSCIALIICSEGYLFYCKLGDTSWTPLPVPVEIAEKNHFIDAIHHKGQGQGQFLALQSTGTVFTCDVDSSPPTVRWLFRVAQTWNHSYLVYCADELFIVSRDNTFKEPTKFEVHKFNEITKLLQDVKDLGSYALFVGFNNSFALSSTRLEGIQGNRIYFTDDTDHPESYNWEAGPNMGIYDLGKSKVKQIRTTGATTSVSKVKPSIWWSPIWWNVGRSDLVECSEKKVKDEA